jgi:hypothetical protein
MDSYEKRREVLKELLENNLPKKDEFTYPMLVRIRLRHEVRVLVAIMSSCNSLEHMSNMIKDIVNKQSCITFDNLYIWYDPLGNMSPVE